MSNQIVGRSQRIYLQTPENGTLLLGVQNFTDNNNHPELCILQGHEVYVLTDVDALNSSSCDEKGNSSPASQIELSNEEKNGEEKRVTNQDEELTSLTWLQNTNLLQNINLKTSAEQRKLLVEKKLVKPVEMPQESDEHDSSWDGSNQSYTDVAPTQTKFQQPIGDEISSKPPHSFSTLIFLAIESSPSKALPVRDIYSWITQHFPYYRNAPIGWKNSVRHNLSLNKCFYKVECGLNLSKGSFWMVDPLHRPQLIQSLCKVSYIKADLIEQLMKETESAAELIATMPTKYKQEASVQEILIKTEEKISPSSSSVVRSCVNLPDPKLFPFLSRRLAFNSIEDPDVEVDAAKAMLSLGQSHLVNNTSSETDNSASQESSTSSQSSPVDDHTYSVSPRPVFKTLNRKLYATGSLKRERLLEPKLAEHVPDMVRELEVRSTTSLNESQLRKQVKLKRTSTESCSGRGRGRGRGRSRSRSRGRGRMRSKCR